MEVVMDIHAISGGGCSAKRKYASERWCVQECGDATTSPCVLSANVVVVGTVLVALFSESCAKNGGSS